MPSRCDRLVVAPALPCALPSRDLPCRDATRGQSPNTFRGELGPDRLVNDDPIANAVEILAGQGIDPTAEGAVIYLPTPVSSPLLPAWQVLAAVPEVSPVAFHCRHDRYPAKLHPSADIRYERQPNRSRTIATTMAGQQPLLPIAAEILVQVGPQERFSAFITDEAVRK